MIFITVQIKNGKKIAGFSRMNVSTQCKWQPPWLDVHNLESSPVLIPFKVSAFAYSVTVAIDTLEKESSPVLIPFKVSSFAYCVAVANAAPPKAFNLYSIT